MSDNIMMPTLRYSEFTDAWEQCKVRDIANRFDNLRIPVAANLRVAGSTPYYGANGIQDYVEGYTHDGEFVLVAEDGANDLKNYPVRCVNGKIWVNNHAHVLQGINDIADNQFLAYSINQADIESLLVGGSRAKLNAETLMDIELILPCLSEQKSIGEFLDNLDRLITFHQRKYDKLVNIKKSMLEKMFPKNGELVPEVRFAGYTDAWEQRKLGELSDITTGKLDANAMTPDGEYDFYTCSLQVYKIDKYAFEGPAITVAGNGYVGCLHLADGKFNAYQRTYVLSNFKAIREYLYAEIGNKLPAKVSQEARNGNIPYIVLDMITDLEVSLPCVEEQKKLADLFTSLERLITLHQRKLEKLHNLKSAFMEKMFV